jgi:hypothetical protein
MTLVESLIFLIVIFLILGILMSDYIKHQSNNPRSSFKYKGVKYERNHH